MKRATVQRVADALCSDDEAESLAAASFVLDVTFADFATLDELLASSTPFDLDAMIAESNATTAALLNDAANAPSLASSTITVCRSKRSRRCPTRNASPPSSRPSRASYRAGRVGMTDATGAPMMKTPPLFSPFDALLAELPPVDLDAVFADLPDIDAVLAACPPFNLDALLADLDASTAATLHRVVSARGPRPSPSRSRTAKRRRRRRI